ncbi:hypothetical protein ACFPM0_15210 [Pseudonocardia sulfidoxydans]|uniref:hypothetical protein n=1 Tax=Pseudonocardia sulfidoxydans TaxID=54011 RepID=UPI003618C258
MGRGRDEDVPGPGRRSTSGTSWVASSSGFFRPTTMVAERASGPQRIYRAQPHCCSRRREQQCGCARISRVRGLRRSGRRAPGPPACRRPRRRGSVRRD